MKDETEYRGSSVPSSLILHPLYWYRRRDSNPHCLVSKTSASCPLGYAGKLKDEGGGMRDEIEIPPSFHPSALILHPLILVDLARFERATSTFA